MSSTSYRPPARPATVTAAHARWLLWLPLMAIVVMAVLLCVGLAAVATPTESPDDTELAQVFTVLIAIAIALPVVVVALVLSFTRPTARMVGSVVLAAWTALCGLGLGSWFVVGSGASAGELAWFVAAVLAALVPLAVVVTLVARLPRGGTAT